MNFLVGLEKLHLKQSAPGIPRQLGRGVLMENIRLGRMLVSVRQQRDRGRME